MDARTQPIERDTPDGAGERIVRLGAVGSTNAIAAEAAAAGDSGPAWFVAERQTAGRGRRGRSWVSEPGNLYASHLATVAPDPMRLGILPLAAAVALGEALAAAAGLEGRIALKWPNDVLVDGAKVAGILLEARHGRPGDPVKAIAGFGVNCAHAPAADGYPTTSLAACGTPTTPDRLLAALAPAWAAARARLAGEGGPGAVRAAWLERGTGIGQGIAVRFEDDAIAGTFAGLDEAGRLLLEGADGERKAIAAGDVFPMMAPAAPGRPPQDEE